MGPLSLPCFGRFARRTRVTSDKRDGASLDLILLTLAFRHTERKIQPPHSIFIPLPSAPRDRMAAIREGSEEFRRQFSPGWTQSHALLGGQ